MANNWLMYVWTLFDTNRSHKVLTQVPIESFHLSCVGVACVSMVQIAATMAAPSKAAKIEYIMKPKVLAFALVLFLALLLSPIMGEANARAHRCIGMSGQQ